MSGKKLRFSWGGDTYEMPEAEALSVMQELGKHGVDVDATPVPDAPDMDLTKDPQALEQPVGTTPSGIQITADPKALADWNAGKQPPAEQPTAAPPAPERDWVDELADLDNWKAAGAGAVHGVTMGTGRLLPDDFGGKAYREWDDAQRAAHPGWYMGGDIGGSFASPVNLLVPGSGMAAQAGKAGLEAAIRGFSDAKPGEGLQDALTNGVADTLTAGALGGIGKFGKYARDTLPVKADLNRVAATGAYGSQMKRMAQNKGAEYVQKLGRAIEEKGLHKADPTKSRLNPTNWIPQGADTYANNAAELEQRASAGMRKAEDAISTLSSPPTVNTTGLINDQRAKIAKSNRMWDPAGGNEAAFRGDFADNIENMSHQVQGAPGGTAHYADWNDALEQRRYIDDNIDWNRLGGYEGAQMQEQARREVAGNLRAELSDSLDRGVSNGTVPDQLATDWKGSRDDYALAAAVRDPAVARVFQEYGNQKISLPSWAAAAGGLATGNPLSAVAAAGVGQMIKHRGAGTVADAQRATSALAGWGGDVRDAMDKMPRGMRTPLATALPSLNSRPDPEVQRQEATRMRGEGRGHMLADNIIRVVTEQPDLLGDYAADFMKAESPLEAEQIAEKLARQNKDFATNIYPQLIGSQ